MPAKRQRRSTMKYPKATTKAAAFYKGHDFSELDFKEIAEALCGHGEGYQIKVRQVRYLSGKIWSVTRDYFSNLDIEQNRPRASMIRQNLTECKKWLRDPWDELQNIPNPLNQLLSQLALLDQHSTDMLTQFDPNILAIFAKFDRLSSAIRRFLKAYEEILLSLQPTEIKRLSAGIGRISKHIKIDKGGRCNYRKSLQKYICDLAAIYEGLNQKPAKQPVYAGDKRFYANQGEFFYFVIACLKAVGDPISESALASQIKIALKSRN
jgi:hypothetical protein